jgi:hypothetical protein
MLSAVHAAGEAPAGAFRAIAVAVDAGDVPLAAYQIEVRVGDTEPSAQIVGVEGGDVDAFRAAPYYDPAALWDSSADRRIVIAAFTVDDNPARGRIRVATLHLFEPAGCVPAYRARLMAAVTADAGGVRDVDATVTLQPGESTP